MATHGEWIKDWLKTNKAYGNCKRAVAEILKEFPELTEVRGHVYCGWGKRSHYWCTDAEGTVVDPTASQFGGIMGYEPWIPGMEVRLGKCMDCGTELWGVVENLEEVPHKSFCDQRCENSFERYMDGP